MLIYDCEIKRAIQGKGQQKDPSLQYCGGWSDFKGMGISVVAAYNYLGRGSIRPRIFMDDNIVCLQYAINEADYVVGWNNHRFDDKLLRANMIKLPQKKSIDLKEIMMLAAGLDPDIGENHKGISLNSVAAATMSGVQKSGNGADAPGLYQSKQYGELVDYCLNDVVVTSRLIDYARVTGHLRNPIDNSWVNIEAPEIGIGG